MGGPLAGRWFLETQDGRESRWGRATSISVRIEKPEPTAAGRVIRSGQVGDEPCVQMMVQFRDSPLERVPCP